MPDKKLLTTSLTTLLLTGCTPAPAIVVFGASFPDWLFCLCGGIAGMALLHILLRTPKKRALLAPQLLSYPALTALISMIIWLLVFSY